MLLLLYDFIIIISNAGTGRLLGEGFWIVCAVKIVSSSIYLVTIINATLTADNPKLQWKKCVVRNMTQLLLLHHLQGLLYMIIQKHHVISHRHLTKGTGASEVGLILILQRSIMMSAMS